MSLYRDYSNYRTNHTHTIFRMSYTYTPCGQKRPDNSVGMLKVGETSNYTPEFSTTCFYVQMESNYSQVW